MLPLGLSRNERGIALVVVLLVLVAVAAVVGGAAVIGSNTSLINKYHDRLSVLETAADAGIELARSAVNGDKTLYPDTAYTTLEYGGAVYTADGTLIPNVRRWLYVGPSGLTTGQYGIFGSVVSVTEDAQGNRVVRRGDVYQESFSKYAYFTNEEGNIVFGAGDQIFGPLHTNDQIKIGTGSPKPVFWGEVVTASTISNRSNGVYKQGYTEHAAAIPMPGTADLNKLKTQAQMGNTQINGSTSGNQGQATTRIEFVALDLNADGDSSDANEGFIRVYQASASNVWWVVADTNGWSGTGNNNGVRNSPNCGHWVTGGTAYHGAEFTTFRNHTTTSGSNQDNKKNAPGMTGGNVQRRCFLGGSDVLNANAANPNGRFLATTDGFGQWLAWPGAVSPLLAGRPDAAYLWPINRELNPNFKGVIYVQGKVAVSGRVRGAITLASPNNIIVADDITYVTNPGAPGRNCRDMLGLFSGQDIVIADNLLNDPIPYLQSTNNVTWDDTKDEFIHGVVLALDNFTVQNYDEGPTNAENCETTNNGRGCIYLTGGIIQKQRGAVGLTNGSGYTKRYSYDACGAESPPPYFPTTGRFSRGHYYEVEPTGFNINTYWNLLLGN